MPFIITATHRPITVKYEEMNDSPIVTATANTTTVECTYKVLWVQRRTFMEQLIGGPIGAGQGLGMYLPHQHPVYTNCYCKTVECNPFGANEAPVGATQNIYLYATVKATYNFEIYAFTGDNAYTSESMEETMNFFPISGTYLSWDAAGTDKLSDVDAPGKVDKGMCWKFTYHRLPYVPPEIWVHVGKVNQYALKSPRYSLTFAPGCVLYDCPVVTAEETLMGWTYEITLSLSAKTYDWNKLLKPTDVSGNMEMVPQTIYYNKKPYRPYTLSDFRNVLPY